MKLTRQLFFISMATQVAPSTLHEHGSLMQAVISSEGMIGIDAHQHRAQMEPRQEGSKLHLRVNHKGSDHLFALELRESNDVSAMRFKSVDDNKPARARVSPDGNVTAWFVLGHDYVQLDWDATTKETSQIVYPWKNMKRSKSLLQEEPEGTFELIPPDGKGTPDDSIPAAGTGGNSSKKPNRTVAFKGDRWYPGCFPQDKERWVAKIGVLVDTKGKEKYPDTWKTRIEDIIDVSSVVYEDQMNIELVIKYNAAGTFTEYTESCGTSDMGSNLALQLGTIQNQTNNWLVSGVLSTHLFSGCDDIPVTGSFTTGLASVGCLGGATCAGANNIAVDWGTFAHELGHNFDGDHSFEKGQGDTGGIMDYGNSKTIDGEHQFNTDYRQCTMCTFLTQLRKSGNSAFYLKSGATAAAVSSYVDLPRGCECKDPVDTYVGSPGTNQYDCSVAVANNWCGIAWVYEDCPKSCNATKPSICTVTAGKAVPWQDNMEWWKVVLVSANACSTGYAHMSSAECLAYVTHAPGVATAGNMTLNNASHPKGCYYRADTKMLYFNSNDGASQTGAKTVCKSTATPAEVAAAAVAAAAALAAAEAAAAAAAEAAAAAAAAAASGGSAPSPPPSYPCGTSEPSFCDGYNQYCGKDWARLTYTLTSSGSTCQETATITVWCPITCGSLLQQSEVLFFEVAEDS